MTTRPAVTVAKLVTILAQIDPSAFVEEVAPRPREKAS